MSDPLASWQNFQAVRAMVNRWERDAEKIKEMFGTVRGEVAAGAIHETLMNLETAIAWGDGIITTCDAARKMKP